MISSSDVLEGCGYDHYRYLMYLLPIYLNAHVIVETGLDQGQSTSIHLLALAELPQPETRVLHTFELYPKPEPVKRVTDLAVRLHVDWRLHFEDSTKGGWSSLIDVLYLDADHSYENVRAEIERFGPSVRRGGVIFTHDTWPSHPEYQHPNEPHRAITDWGAQHGWRSVLLKTPEGMTYLWHPN